MRCVSQNSDPSHLAQHVTNVFFVFTFTLQHYFVFLMHSIPTFNPTIYQIFFVVHFTREIYFAPTHRMCLSVLWLERIRLQVMSPGWADSMECCCYQWNIQDLLSDGKALRAAVRRIIQRTKNSDSFSSTRKSYHEYSAVMCYTRAESGNETFWSQTLMNWRRWTHLKSIAGDSMRRKC